MRRSVANIVIFRKWRIATLSDGFIRVLLLKRTLSFTLLTGKFPLCRRNFTAKVKNCKILSKSKPYASKRGYCNPLLKRHAQHLHKTCTITKGAYLISGDRINQLLATDVFDCELEYQTCCELSQRIPKEERGRKKQTNDERVFVLDLERRRTSRTTKYSTKKLNVHPIRNLRFF